MKIDIEKYELIGQYLAGDLSGIEFLDFEKKLRENKTFAEEVESHKAVNDLIIDQGLLDLKQKIKRYNEDRNNNGKTKNYLISAVIGLLSLTSIFYFIDGTQHKVKEVNNPVIQKHFQSNEIQEVDVKREENQKVALPKPAIKKANKSVFIDSAPSTDSAKYHFPDSRISPAGPDNKIFNLEQKTTIGIPEAASVKERIQLEICILNNLTFDVSATASCTSYPSGKITVNKESIEEGTPPFTFSIDDKNYTSQVEFIRLEEGSYFLYVLDANGCKGILDRPINVEEKNCDESNEYYFSPTKGEVWEIPLRSYSNCKIDIYNKQGSLVYSSLIKNGYPNQWFGVSNSGRSLPSGSYTFIIKAAKESVQGSVTLIK